MFFVYKVDEILRLRLTRVARLRISGWNEILRLKASRVDTQDDPLYLIFLDNTDVINKCSYSYLRYTN